MTKNLLWALSLSCVFPSVVRAQTITPIEDVSGVIERTGERRPDANLPDAINYQDCRDDVQVTFHLVLSGLDGTDTLEVWAGAGSSDCTDLSIRKGDAPGCWLVYQGRPDNDRWDVTLSAQDLVTGNGDRRNFMPGQGTLEGCDENAVDIGLTIYFFFTGDGDEAVSPTTWTNTPLNLLGPRPPTNLEVGVGEGILPISWTTNATPERQGITIFCDPVEGDEGPDAGTPECPSSFPVGTRPPGNVLALECGSTGANASLGVARGLQNGQLYAMAVSSTDDALNFGALSEVVCGTPEPVIDFFELYRSAGGQGGGGYCSLTRTPSRPPLWMCGMAALLGLLAYRRRSRSVPRKSVSSRVGVH